MKVRSSIIVSLMVILIVGGISSLQTIQVNAIETQGDGPLETWIVEYISTNPNAGSHVSIALDEDNDNTPWIAYYNETYGGLYVAHFVGEGNGDCFPNDAWLCEQVDHVHAQYKGMYTSIDIYPDTNPLPYLSTWKVGVSYFDDSNNSLKYAIYSCPLGGCQWTVQTVDSSTDVSDEVGKYTSLKYSSKGIANISYHYYNDMGYLKSESLKYAYYVGSGDGDCGDGNNWDCETIDSGFYGVGKYNSLDLDMEDRVYISYYNADESALFYTYYVGFGGNCGEIEDWQCAAIDNPDGKVVGYFTSMHARKSNEDMMRIAYYNKTDGTLMYAWDIPGTGNCGEFSNWQCDMIEEIGSDLSQVGISLAVDEELNPIIAYADGHEDLAPLGLRVASPAFFKPYANCGGDLIYSWYCRDIDNGAAYLDVAQYAAIAMKPNGVPVVAYSETDDYEYPVATNLKVAYPLGIKTVLPMVVK